MEQMWYDEKDRQLICRSTGVKYLNFDSRDGDGADLLPQHIEPSIVLLAVTYQPYTKILNFSRPEYSLA